MEEQHKEQPNEKSIEGHLILIHEALGKAGALAAPYAAYDAGGRPMDADAELCAAVKEARESLEVLEGIREESLANQRKLRLISAKLAPPRGSVTNDSLVEVVIPKILSGGRHKGDNLVPK